MTKTEPIPAIALTASRLLDADYERNRNIIAGQTLDAMNLNPQEGWKVDFGSGQAFREVPDIAPAEDSAAA